MSVTKKKPDRTLFGIYLYDEHVAVQTENKVYDPVIYQARCQYDMIRFHDGGVFLGYVRKESPDRWTFHCWLNVPGKNGLHKYEIDKKNYYKTEQRAIAGAIRWYMARIIDEVVDLQKQNQSEN